MSSIALTFLVSLTGALAPASSNDVATGKEFVVPVKVQEPNGYAGNPSTLERPLRQDLQSIALTARPDGKFDIRLKPTADAPHLDGVDLRPLIPRVPALAKGDPVLTRIALFQRELNRNETQFGAAPGTDDFRLANNCLRGGLWEVMLAKKKESGMALDYHGWFQFPKEVYAALFQQMNGVPYTECESFLDQYPNMGGFDVPLAALRKVERETASLAVSTHLNEAIGGFGEQKRKAKLVLTPGVATFGDFVAKDKQPIATAKFTEPGFYDTADPVKFDLSWLAKPSKATWRKVRGVRAPVALDEVEIPFENGYRILFGHEDLAKLVARTEPAAADGDTLRLTFGISTPEIYAPVAQRTAEFEAPKNGYLFLVDAKGQHIDNHAAGVDRIFVWRSAGEPNLLHIYLVGYERIAFVSHLTLPWQG